MSVPQRLDWKHYGVVKYAESVYHIWRVAGSNGSLFQVTNSREIVPPFGCGHYTALQGVLARFQSPAQFEPDPEAAS